MEQSFDPVQLEVSAKSSVEPVAKEGEDELVVFELVMTELVMVELVFGRLEVFSALELVCQEPQRLTSDLKAAGQWNYHW
jgi:hypothetical protein